VDQPPTVDNSHAEAAFDASMDPTRLQRAG
jgi:hypothetical protein